MVVRDLRGRAVDPGRHAVAGSSLAPEGGAHQSIVTPSIGIGQPGCTSWEPAFGQDLEWTLLHALSRLGRPDGESAYFRLSTRPIDQALAGEDASDERRELVLAGGYPLRRAEGTPRVTLVGMGAVMPEVLRGRGRARRRTSTWSA